ncbi:MAG: glycosyltransferase family 1 protein [Nitrospirae bacterium]|nr:MAG: glycosyltransferase family 1 protein [Nitrospirota bacterium]
MKKIVIAAWHLANPNVGIGRYCRSLLDTLGRIESQYRFEIFVPIQHVIQPSRGRLRFRAVRLPVFRRRTWEQVVSLLASPYDLLHFPHDSSVIWKRGKFLVTIHDVKPLLFPPFKSKWNLNRWLYQMFVPDRCQQADRILTVSQYSRKDLMTHLNLPPERISVVYQGVDTQTFHPLSASEKSSYVGKKFILSVAGEDPTKNLETLIQAFAQLPSSLRETHELILAGDLRRRADLRELVGDLRLYNDVRFSGVVSEHELVRLYQQASVFVFPSLYEGFGLPVLEAMACGCPVICSNTSSLPEVAGESAYMFDPKDSGALARALEYVLTDAGMRKRLVEAGLARARQFTWEQTASELMAVYDSMLHS